MLRDAIEVLFPHASKRTGGRGVVASDAFDDFIADITPYVDTLPVVTAELGDTWLMGANADAYKVAIFRAASREYTKCMRSGGEAACLGTSSSEAAGNTKQPTASDVAALRTFERLLMVATEHTWGWNLGNVRHKAWSNPELQEAIATDKEFQTSIGTWKEQRAFVPNALAALPSASPLAKAVTAAIAEIWRGNATDHPAAATAACGDGGSQVVCDLSYAAASFDVVRQHHQQQHRHHQAQRQRQQSTSSSSSSSSSSSRSTVSVHEAGDVVQCGAFEVAFGTDGSIVHLQTTGVAGDNEDEALVWVDAARPLARVWCVPTPMHQRLNE